MSSSLGTRDFDDFPSPTSSNGSYVERLQLGPNDPRWALEPPYGWFPLRAKFRGFCWYCGERVEEGSPCLFSKKLSMLAHHACRGPGA